MSPWLSELFLSSQSDERLVALARAGHERAFAAIVERYRPELQVLARRLCADGRGEDVVQQAFLSAFAALRSGAEVKHLRGWLYRILRNAAYRSRAPQFAPLDSATASVETVEDVVQQRALAMSALTELARLPERQRQAMVETVGGMARSEVASTMGLSEGAVRQLVHRARSTLRTAVTAITPWPMARWFAALGQSTPGSTELAAGVGVASSGGIALKLGALIASGTLATGVAAVDLHGGRPHQPATRAATSGHAHTSVQRAAPVVVVAASPAAHAVGAARVEASLTKRVDLQRGRHESGQVRSGTRHRGSGRHDGSGDGSGDGSRGSGSGSRGDDAAGRGAQSGHGDSSSSGSGSTHQDGGGASHSGGDGRADGGDGGSGLDSGGSSGSIASAGSSQARGDLTSTQPVVDSSHDGSGSANLIESGSTSGKGGGSSDGSSSGDGSGGGSGSGSGSHDGGSPGN